MREVPECLLVWLRDLIFRLQAIDPDPMDYKLPVDGGGGTGRSKVTGIRTQLD
jgi:hypothetical protein